VSERFPAYFGLWNVSFVRGDLIPMQDVAATFLRDVESEPQSPDAAMAHRICGTTLFYEGNFVAARQHLEQVLAICNAVRDREPVFRFGLDVASPAMTYLALTLWALGRFGRACSLMEEAVARALETGHIPTIALAHDQAAGFEMMRRDRLRTAPHARALLSLAREHGMPVWIANGMFRHGWSRWDADHEAGMAEMRQGIALLRLQQHEASLPTMMTAFKPLVDLRHRAEEVAARFWHRADSARRRMKEAGLSPKIISGGQRMPTSRMSRCGSSSRPRHAQVPTSSFPELDVSQDYS
jgi:hypothetical protein